MTARRARTEVPLGPLPRPLPFRPPYSSAPRGPGSGNRHCQRQAAHAAQPVVSSPWRWGEEVVAVSRSRRTRCYSGAARARWDPSRLFLPTGRQCGLLPPASRSLRFFPSRRPGPGQSVYCRIVICLFLHPFPLGNLSSKLLPRTAWALSWLWAEALLQLFGSSALTGGRVWRQARVKEGKQESIEMSQT